MKQAKITKKLTAKQQKEETAKVLTHFFKESSKIVNTTLKEVRHKYPDLFKTS